MYYVIVPSSLLLLECNILCNFTYLHDADCIASSIGTFASASGLARMSRAAVTGHLTANDAQYVEGHPCLIKGGADMPKPAGKRH